MGSPSWKKRVTACFHHLSPSLRALKQILLLPPQSSWASNSQMLLIMSETETKGEQVPNVRCTSASWDIGCATSQGSQMSTAPTIGGPILMLVLGGLGRDRPQNGLVPKRNHVSEID